MDAIYIVAAGVVFEVEVSRDATGRPYARARESSGTRSFLGFGLDAAECLEDLLRTVQRVYPEAMTKVSSGSGLALVHEPAEGPTKKAPRRPLKAGAPRKRPQPSLTSTRGLSR
jgi:hypothetical protein